MGRDRVGCKILVFWAMSLLSNGYVSTYVPYMHDPRERTRFPGVSMSSAIGLARGDLGISAVNASWQWLEH